MSHFENFLNTVLQVLAGLAVLVPLAVLNAATLGWQLPGPALAALVGAATLLVASVYNVVRQRGSTPILRTFLQIVVAVAGVSAGVVAELNDGGIAVDGPKVAAIAGLAVAVASMVMNLTEQVGWIPVLDPTNAERLFLPRGTTAAKASIDPLCVGCDPVAPHGVNRELIDRGEVR